MAAIVKGTAHIFGVVTGTITNASIQSYTYKKAPKNTSETVDEVGNEIEWRLDDIQTEITFEIKLKAAYTEPAIGDVLTFNSIAYCIMSIDGKEEAKAHKMLTLTAKKGGFTIT